MHFLEGLSINESLGVHAENGDVEKVRACVAQGANVNWTDPNRSGVTCLMRAMLNRTDQTRFAVVEVSSI